MTQEILVIDRATVRRLLPYEECIPLMREAMMALSSGEATATLRQIIDLGGGGAFGVMPGALPEVFGAKLISVAPPDPVPPRPSHQGAVCLFDPDTGALAAVIHAGEITSIRTAAASAAASLALARPASVRLAILGAGEQAQAHAEALCAAFDLEDIRLWARSEGKAEALAARLGPGPPVRVARDVKSAVEDADIICATTAAFEPILNGAWVAEGAHVNLVGSSRPGPREVDDALVVRARVFADDRLGVLVQGAEVLHAKALGLIGDEHVLGEIGEVMAGAIPGRISPSDVTVYKSLGSVAQDLASGWRVYQKARHEGAGTRMAF